MEREEPLSRTTEIVTRCDRCHKRADGDDVDHIRFLTCGHDICTNCYRETCRICGAPSVVGRPPERVAIRTTAAEYRERMALLPKKGNDER